MAVKWKIWYDGSVSYTGDPWVAPAWGVQVIVMADPEHGRYARVNHDYYWYVPERDIWEGGDFVGMIDYLAQPGPKRVIFGRLVPNSLFSQVYQAAMDDPDFAPKTAHAYRERVVT